MPYLHSFLLACVRVPSAESNEGPGAGRVPGAGRGRGVISASSCARNVTAQLGLAARLFCCLATPELGQPGTQVSWVKVEDLSIISHHDTLFSTDKRISVCSRSNNYSVLCVGSLKMPILIHDFLNSCEAAERSRNVNKCQTDQIK